MASLNKVLIIGNLGRDPETRFATEGGLQITTINVATSRSYRSQASGQLVEETEWHRIVFFGKQAET
ncbi:MAG: single-stranded DNA-binding protein, partial [Turicimonas muris]